MLAKAATLYDSGDDAGAGEAANMAKYAAAEASIRALDLSDPVSDPSWCGLQASRCAHSSAPPPLPRCPDPHRQPTLIAEEPTPPSDLRHLQTHQVTRRVSLI
jgi:hypothetical protein